MFSSLTKFYCEGRENHSIASELEGTLLISRSHFPYFMLIAFEAGGPIRALLLLILSPIICLLECFGLDAAAFRIMTFVTMAGLRVTDVKAVAKAVLPRFYLEDLCEITYRVFSKCKGKKYVVTSSPRIMVEAFLREYMDVDYVIGTEIATRRGYCIGLLSSPGVMTGVRRLEALGTAVGYDDEINVGLGDGRSDHPFMWLCKEGYIVPTREKAVPLPRKDYPKPLIFHDGRLVARPTPLDCVAVVVWLPLGVILAIARILIGIILPYQYDLLVAAATGFKIRANFPPNTCEPCHTTDHPTYNTPLRNSGILYVCSHRTLMDPVLISSTLQHHVTAVTYSVSRVSEVLSPIRTVRLSRDREKDGKMMQSLLEQGDLVVCPEGTTCREPYLLRFSPLFAEIADDVVPVAVTADASIFYGTTVRGYKWLDSFFFLMNPNPNYRLNYLERLPRARECTSLGRSSYDIANHVQSLIGQTLEFECTNFTRRDKYRMLAGTDGVGSQS